MIKPSHISVMPNEVINAVRDCVTIVDATFGMGGHSRLILEANDHCVVYGIDQDPVAQKHAEDLKRDFPNRFVFLRGNFCQMREKLLALGVQNVDAVLMDIGVSSVQLDEAVRGFSFRYDGPLDMRMSGAGLSAEDVVNDYAAEDLSRIIRRLGEENLARKITQNIVRHRDQGRITRTEKLADIVREVKQRRGAKIDPATKTFQAIRMHVNAELESLEGGLEAAEMLLSPNGVLCVLSFHSLEDRIVKRFLKARIEQSQGSRHLPPQELPAPIFELMHRGVLRADSDEVLRNPRSRSAKLRVARKLAVGGV